MKIFVINLARDVERMAHMDRQLASMRLAYERVEAVDARSLDSAALRVMYSPARWRCANGRAAGPGEIACAASHYGVYKKLSAPACILEDDVDLSPDFGARLDEVARFIDASRSQVVVLSDLKGRRAAAAAGKTGIVSSQGAYCTDAYVITPCAARAILAANFPLIVPCDHWGRFARRGIVEIFHSLPAVAVQRGDVFGSSIDPSRRIHRSRGCVWRIFHALPRAIGLGVDWLDWKLHSWTDSRA